MVQISQAEREDKNKQRSIISYEATRPQNVHDGGREREEWAEIGYQSSPRHRAVCFTCMPPLALPTFLLPCTTCHLERAEMRGDHKVG